LRPAAQTAAGASADDARWIESQESSMRYSLVRAAVIGVAVLLIAPHEVRAQQKSKPVPATHAEPLTVTVLWDDAMSGKEAGVWMGYLFARMKYVSNNGRQYKNVPGVVQPLYEEEVHARTEAVFIYRDIRSRKPEMAAPYFDELDKVEAAGFMREYVWRYLRSSHWVQPAAPLRDAEFDRWASEHLRTHAVQTRGRIALTRGSG
jgi:hypothetical protein